MKKATKIFAGCAIAVTMLATPFAFAGCGAPTGVDVITSEGKTNYSTFAAAYEHAKAGDTIKLNQNVNLESRINLDKSLIIDGQNKYTIKATGTFEGTSGIFYMDVGFDSVTVKFKDVTVDANSKNRILVAKSGKIVIDDATLKGGYVNNTYIAGVYITHGASFEMTGGTITNNQVDVESYKNDNYMQYTADLWIGANATGIAKITGGKIDNVFVNSNEYSANNPGSFTFDGGNITNIYVEYDQGFGATFKYVSGNIENLYVSTTTGNGNSTKVEAVAGYIYKGGAEKIAITE